MNPPSPKRNTTSNENTHAQRGIRKLSSNAAVATGEQFPKFIVNAPATETSTLSNGLRVASQSGHGETATVGVWIDAGSRYETERNNGVAHFLEHMAFKGTHKRTRMQMEEAIENMGGHLNAYTSREQTVYYAQVFKDDVPQAMDILSDILLNSKFDEDAIVSERDVILRELREVQMQTEEVIFDCLHEVAYAGGGLGRTILGPPENIQSISKSDLEEYIKTHYTAPRMVVAGAGAVNHQELTELADKHFGSLASQPAAGLTVPSDPVRFIGSEIRVREDNMPLAHVAISFESMGWTDPASFPLLIMQTLLGSWNRTQGSGKNMASKLANAAAEDELCHSFTSFNTQYKDTGLFGVYAVMDPTTVNDMVWHCMDKMVYLCHKVTAEEVERAKQQLKANVLMHQDGTSAVCEDIGRQMLTYGRRMTPAEIFARIDAVDAAAVMDVAKTVINDQDVAVAAVGNINELPDYNWIRRRTFWLRY